MNPLIQNAFASWTPPVATIAMLLFTAALYARGFARLHRQMPDRFPPWRLAMFMGGIVALFIAIASPLEELDDLLLQVHMTQHMLLMIVAPPLLLAGAPAIALVRGMPALVAKAIVGPMLRSGAVRRIFAWLTQPLVCWIAFSAATWGWHLPAAFQLALRSDGWHVVEHACFFTTALMFWYPVVQPWPSVARWPRWAMIPYLLLADGQNTVLAALFMFSDRLIYPVYATAPRSQTSLRWAIRSWPVLSCGYRGRSSTWCPQRSSCFRCSRRKTCRAIPGTKLTIIAESLAKFRWRRFRNL